MANVDFYTIQRAGGWKTQVMVQRYSHLSPDHIKAPVERLARRNSGPATGTKTGTTETSSGSERAAGSYHDGPQLALCQAEPSRNAAAPVLPARSRRRTAHP